jgi:hypothetical protein
MPKKPYPSQTAPKPKPKPRGKAQMFEKAADLKVDPTKYIGRMGTPQSKRGSVTKPVPLPQTGIMGSTEKQRQDVRNAALKQMEIKTRQKRYNG